jgi:hypothetical protein
LNSFSLRTYSRTSFSNCLVLRFNS